MIGHLLSFMQGIGGDILLGVGRHRLLALLSLGSAVVNIVLSVILVQIIGLPGVAWGTTIPLSLLSLFYVPFAAIRLVGGRPLAFLREAFLPPLAASVLPALFIIVASRRLTSLWEMAAALIILAVIYLLSAYLIALKPEEKIRIRSILHPPAER
jgi:O-antigen/teichoic acid export membrane protein